MSPPHTNGRAADRRQKLGTTPLVSSPHDLTFVVHFFKKNQYADHTRPDSWPPQPPEPTVFPFFCFPCRRRRRTNHHHHHPSPSVLTFLSLFFFFAWNPLNSLFPGLRCLPADLARPSPVGVGGETRKGTQKKTTKKPVRRRTSRFSFVFSTRTTSSSPNRVRQSFNRKRNGVEPHTPAPFSSLVSVSSSCRWMKVFFGCCPVHSFIHSFSPFFRVAYRRNMRPNHHYCPSYEFHYFHY